jgi:hypothetical protein
MGSPQESGSLRISPRGDAPSGNGDRSSPDLRCRSPGLSAGSSLGHVPHVVSQGLRPVTPVASPSQLYYPAGTLAPGPVLTPLLTGVNNDIYLHMHGLDRGIFTNDPNVQADPDLQDQASGHHQASTSTRHLHRVPTTSTDDQALALASRAPRTP